MTYSSSLPCKVTTLFPKKSKQNSDFFCPYTIYDLFCNAMATPATPKSSKNRNNVKINRHPPLHFTNNSYLCTRFEHHFLTGTNHSRLSCQQFKVSFVNSQLHNFTNPT